MSEQGVTDDQMRAITEGIHAVLNVAQQKMPIYDFGHWRHTQWRDNGQLRPFHSVDWYLERAQEESDRAEQLNADTLLNLLAMEPWRNPDEGGQRHYDVVVLQSDLYSGSDNNRFIIGGAYPDLGAAISVNRFQGLEPSLQFDCIVTETIHEMGHVFGLIPPGRQRNVEESLGKHCTNVCSMRQGVNVPMDWIRFTRDRLQQGPFCTDCEQDLRGFFA